MQSIALVESGEFAIDGTALDGWDPGPDTSRHPETGRLYPNKPPGASLLGAAAYGSAKAVTRSSGEPTTLRSFTWWARLFGGVLPTLLIVGLGWRRYARSRGSAAVALALLLYALASPAASYAHLFYGHQLAACLLFLGVGWLADGGETGRWPFAMAGGFAAASAVSVEYGAVFAGIPIGVLLVMKGGSLRGLKVMAAAIAGSMAPVFLLARYHAFAFGHWASTGYHNAVDASFAAKHGVGLLGLSYPTWDGFFTHVISPGGGLLFWCPLFPLGLWGLLQIATSRELSERRDEARLHLTIFVVILIVGCGLSFDGGWRVGPRYMVIALPGLILGWCHAFAQLRTEPIRMGIVACLGTASLLVNTLAANLWPHIDLTNIYGPIADVLVPLLKRGYQPYGPMWATGFEGGAWMGTGGCAAVVTYSLFRLGEFGARMTLAIMTGLAMAVYLVFSFAPAFTPQHPNAARNLRYIEGVYEPAPRSRRAGESRRLGYR